MATTGKIVDDVLNAFKAFGKEGKKVADDFIDMMGAKEAGEEILKSNKAIKARPFMQRGIHGAINNYAESGDIGDAIKKAFTYENGKLNAGTIAGSYFAASTGYRALSGGGLYKDKNGTTNIAGLPFV